MSDNTAPVIAGLAVGIIFVMMFSVLMRPSSQQQPEVVTVVIPRNPSDPVAEHNNFEPASITVVIGVNNTVRWVNESDVPMTLEANKPEAYPDFTDALCADNNGFAGDCIGITAIMPGESFNYTFTNTGQVGYHSKPWMIGTVNVLDVGHK